MPELPEVEVSKQGITPHLLNKQVTALIIRQPNLRWPIPDDVHKMVDQKITGVSRRAKYLLLHTSVGSMILHLGMSGTLRVISAKHTPIKHDHLELVLSDGQCLRFNDPRRFGACLWQAPDTQHPLLTRLGPEPLTDAFSEDLLYHLSRNKQSTVKSFIMDNHVVVGVGNIYASEALFMAGINPNRKASSVGKARYQQLTMAIKEVLAKAIAQGGTTLKDFTQVDGKPGYFAQQLQVYGRSGKACNRCDGVVVAKVIAQRNTYYCKGCQR